VNWTPSRAPSAAVTCASSSVLIVNLLRQIAPSRWIPSVKSAVARSPVSGVWMYPKPWASMARRRGGQQGHVAFPYFGA
jgi:hypothetical protein